MNRLKLVSQSISQTPITMENLQTVRIQIKSSVGTIWFNKEESLNSISVRMGKEFKFVLEVLDTEQKVKIILIRSNHPKVFCVGADLKNVFFTVGESSQSPAFPLLQKTFLAIRKPIVSVVDGLALGGGFQIALLSDIILCSKKAKFQLPEINIGIFPGLGGTQFLTRAVGTKVGIEMILTGSPINGSKADDLNIATCLPSDNFGQRVDQFVQILLNRATDSLQFAKKAVNSSLSTTLSQGLELQASIFQRLFSKQAAKQGLSAFVQKRKPNFRQM